MPRTRPPYPEEFRREAIRLALLGDKPQRQQAKDLGISDVTLRNLLKQERAERGERRGGLSQDEREELQRPGDENARLRMEREILAKGGPSASRRRANGRVGEVGSLCLIAAEKTSYPVAVMGRVFGVNRTGFHNWERRARSDSRLKSRKSVDFPAPEGPAIQVVPSLIPNVSSSSTTVPPRRKLT